MSFISKNKEIKTFVQDLLKTGKWQLRSGSKHKCHLEHESGWKCPIPSTPGDWRAYQNFKARTHRMLNMTDSGQTVPCRLA